MRENCFRFVGRLILRSSFDRGLFDRLLLDSLGREKRGRNERIRVSLGQKRKMERAREVGYLAFDLAKSTYETDESYFPSDFAFISRRTREISSSILTTNKFNFVQFRFDGFFVALAERDREESMKISDSLPI